MSDTNLTHSNLALGSSRSAMLGRSLLGGRVFLGHMAAALDERGGSATPPPPEGPTDPATLADLIKTKDELSLKLGNQVLSLGYRARGRRKLAIRPLVDCADNIRVTDVGGPYQIKPAWTGPEAVLNPRSRTSGDIVPPEGRVAVFRNAQVNVGVVTTEDGVTIAESLARTEALDRFGRFTRDAHGFLHQSRPRFSVRKRIRGRPAVVLTDVVDSTTTGSTRSLDSYGRWLVESLPRLAIVESHFDLRELTFIVPAASDPMRAIQDDSLALFGIRPDQIVEAGDETLVVDDLIYPAPLVSTLYARDVQAFAPRCIEVLEQIATRVRANPFGFQRLYVYHPATSPRVANEAKVIALAKTHGFTVVEPESLSLYQQIGLFRQARIVVGTPGPALVNALFSTDHLTLIALTPPSRSDVFENLMSLKDGRYMVSGGEPGLDRDDTTVTVDLDRFHAILAVAIDPSSR